MSLNIDFTNVKETNGFTPLNPGDYLVIGDECELKQTKDGSGEYIAVKFKVLSENGAGRFLFHNFNIKNKNPKAVEIGMGQLKTFMRMSGIDTSAPLTSVTNLVGYRVNAVVKIRQDQDGEMRNVISGFKPHVNEEKDVPFA